MLHLKVDIEPNSGFCFGVRKAIKKAESALNENKELYSLGEIVHNDEEIKRLESKGLKTISSAEFARLKNKIVLFRAHGEPPISYDTAEKNNVEIIDASCPIILKLQEKIFQSYEKGESIYIFGVPNHPEIVGLNGKIKNSALVFEKVEELDLDQMPEKITLYSQTTKSLKQFYSIIEYLESQGKKVHVVDSICRQVSNRESELRQFCRKFDVIVFVAGHNSSNGKQLFAFCRQENDQSHFISGINDIDKNWFKENNNVGICGATSTPLWLIQQVREFLLAL